MVATRQLEAFSHLNHHQKHPWGFPRGRRLGGARRSRFVARRPRNRGRRCHWGKAAHTGRKARISVKHAERVPPDFARGHARDWAGRVLHLVNVAMDRFGWPEVAALSICDPAEALVRPGRVR